MKKLLLITALCTALLSACVNTTVTPGTSSTLEEETKSVVSEDTQPEQSNDKTTSGTPPQESSATSDNGSAELLSEPYVHYIAIDSSYGKDLMFPCIRGQEVLKEEDHTIYRNSGVTMEIMLSDKSESAEDILLSASGIPNITEADDVIYNRSGDTIYIVDSTNSDFTVLYTIESDAYADRGLFTRALGLFGIEGEEAQ